MKIAFFCIPAFGHTNPTLEVVRELVKRGNEVRYYSYDILKEKIEAVGAQYFSCDKYDIGMSLKPEDSLKIGKDIAFSTEILVNTTLALDEAMTDNMRAWKPDCIVADSMATWGRLTALKLGIPLVSSTTTFAFNRYSAKSMKHSASELPKMLLGMFKANKQVKRLRGKGYPVKNVFSVIANDNETQTIVYTSPEFQPFSETFSDKYAFVGPSLPDIQPLSRTERKLVYISLGTVINKNELFYKNCIKAFSKTELDVIMSVGGLTDISSLGEIPDNIKVEKTVDQLSVLQRADAFITHCGMNSASEALYLSVPLVLFPQTDEQGAVASRVSELGAGKYLTDNSPEVIKNTVTEVLNNPQYGEAAKNISDSFHRCGGARAAADKIEKTAKGV